jgi:hypothetical protein
MHHIPTLELNITDIPFFALLVAFKNKTTLLSSDEDHNLFFHDHLLLSITGPLRLSETE